MILFCRSNNVLDIVPRYVLMYNIYIWQLRVFMCMYVCYVHVDLWGVTIHCTYTYGCYTFTIISSANHDGVDCVDDGSPIPTVYNSFLSLFSLTR